MVLENDGKHSLYRVEDNQSIEPLKWAQDQKRLELYPEYNLVITDDWIYTLDGDAVLSGIKRNKISFAQMQRRLLVKSVSEDKSGADIYVFWWDGYKKGNGAFSHNMVLYNEKYVVCNNGCYGPDGPSWEVYTDIGKKVDIGKIGNCDVNLVGDFLVVEGMGQKKVYNLKLKKCLKDQQQWIVPSPYANFVMCCSISGGLQTYYRGRWKKHGNIENFGLLSEELGIFYVVKNGKYFLYTFENKPFLNTLYPSGLDFVAYNSEDMSCVLVNNGKVRFYT